MMFFHISFNLYADMGSYKLYIVMEENTNLAAPSTIFLY